MAWHGAWQPAAQPACGSRPASGLPSSSSGGITMADADATLWPATIHSAFEAALKGVQRAPVHCYPSGRHRLASTVLVCSNDRLAAGPSRRACVRCVLSCVATLRVATPQPTPRCRASRLRSGGAASLRKWMARTPPRASSTFSLCASASCSRDPRRTAAVTARGRAPGGLVAAEAEAEAGEATEVAGAGVMTRADLLRGAWAAGGGRGLGTATPSRWNR
jgi:hypothetical protein